MVPVNLRERVPGFESWWDVPIAAVSEQAEINATRLAYEQKLAEQVPYFAATASVKETQ